MRAKLLVSERLYGALLYLYPKEFRAVYGRQMRQTFRDVCRAAYHRNGIGGLLALWLPTLFDLFKSALEERARQGEIIMSKARLIPLAGPLAIIVGLLWILLAISDVLLRNGVDNEMLLALWAIPFIFSFIPMLFALIGTRLRFHHAASVLGRFGLALSVAGCAGVIVFILAAIPLGMLAPEVAQRPWLNYATVFSFLSIRLGLVLFGIDALRIRLLPRWNLLPLLLGLTVVFSFGMDWFGVSAFLPSSLATPFLHFAVTGACWALLGLAILEQSREPQPTAAI